MKRSLNCWMTPAKEPISINFSALPSKNQLAAIWKKLSKLTNLKINFTDFRLIIYEFDPDRHRKIA